MGGSEKHKRFTPFVLAFWSRRGIMKKTFRGPRLRNRRDDMKKSQKIAAVCVAVLLIVGLGFIANAFGGLSLIHISEPTRPS